MEQNLNDTAKTGAQNTEPQTAEPVWFSAPVPDYSLISAAKLNWKLQTHDLVFSWLTLVLGFLFMRYVLVYADGFFTTGFFLLLFFCGEIFLRKSGCKPKLPQQILGIVICLFTTVFSITASPLLHGLTFLFLVMAIVWRANAVGNGTAFVTRFFPFDMSDSLFAHPLRHYSAGPQAISDTVKKSAAATSVKMILLGLLITIPLVMLLVEWVLR